MNYILQTLAAVSMISLLMMPLSSVAQSDYGDAPDPTYPTLASSAGAHHVIVAGVFLGASVDAEPDGQPGILALGDDVFNDDEDGIMFTSPLASDESATIEVTASTNGMLDAWIDFNSDGDWADSGEQIFASEPLIPGTNVLGFTVSSNATPTSLTFARFRFSAAGGLAYDGAAPDGEVEDYPVIINGLDFGDAPDPTYATLRASDGARHILSATGPFLGASVDAEADGQPGVLALADDFSNNDDEDGVTFASSLIVGEPASIDVTASRVSMLDAWIDYNSDGDWADPGEQVFAGRPLVAGSNVLGFTVPATATAIATNVTFARFRVSSSGGLSFDGPAPDGEVEDYAIAIRAVDFGDAPDPIYPTLRASDGARHILGFGLFLGTNVDAETDGQSTGVADGDDTNGIPDDEDGIVFTSPLITGEPTTIELIAFARGRLDAWIDYNSNGDWGDVGEQVFSRQLVVAGTNTLGFTVPVTATPTNMTFARFRISIAGGLGFDGIAPDGEVEDYGVAINGIGVDGLDFGDAPDPSYPTLRASDGARHILGVGPFFGTHVDGDADGQPDARAIGDDLNTFSPGFPFPPGDEDGVSFTTRLASGEPAIVAVVVSGSTLLDAWIDFNGDGDWGDAGEQVFTSQPLSAGAQSLPFTVPVGATPTNLTFARFRVSTAGGLEVHGAALDGEVEDYPLAIYGLDFGDAPEAYPTLRASDGARHILGTGIFLGADVDAEADGQPGFLALSDDVFNDDEDGVTLTASLFIGEFATVDVTASRISFLDAWIDYNSDGDWADPGEQIFASQSLVAGSNSLGFTVPGTATPTNLTFARFRVSSAGGLGFDGPAPDGEVEDYPIVISTLDYGDAPDPTYPTLRASDGARHILTSGLFLGANVDGESDGQPTGAADGDDGNGIPDDEDGVVFTSPLIAGETSTIEVIASAGGLLDAWIDYDNDGDWGDAGEQVFTNQLVVAGTNALGFTVPATATPTNVTFARFRVSTAGGLNFDGSAPDGEVEDYGVAINGIGVDGLDFGDAPDPTYMTLRASNGARHILGTGPFLGINVDDEADGQPGLLALGDDLIGEIFNDDEDGVTFTASLIFGEPATVDVVVSGSTLLDAWIDFNGDGDWGDAGEQVFMSQPLIAGTNSLGFTAPVSARPTIFTFARFRVSTAGGLSFDGAALDGEVEDYLVTIFGQDFGDAPDLPYPTLRVSNGARHILGIGPFLGADVDAEADGQPGFLALGDDFFNDDEDGVTLTSLLAVGEPAGIDVIASGVSMLDAWIDYNSDGDWADSGEQIFANQPLVAGSNSLGFTVPATATPTNLTFARFRVSRAGGLGFDGPAPDGEVEDYPIVISTLDYGDAPDPTYPTLRASDGARHILSSLLFLGANVDGESDGQPTGAADGDDTNGISDDEDGVVFTSPLIAGEPITIEVIASAGGLLDAWIDFNSDGDWGDAGEQIFANQPVAAGTNALGVTVPVTATPTNAAFARFRVSTAGGLGFDGASQDGEVEDYVVVINGIGVDGLDFGDAPDPTYATLRASDGARHILGVGPFLGVNVDGDADGQPDTQAIGDDLNTFTPGIPFPPGDEDGVAFMTPLAGGEPATIDVVVSGNTLLDAWIDFNGDGDWSDAGEQVFTSRPLLAGTNSLDFTVPASARPTNLTFARFRVSMAGGLEVNGAALDGEVEDYPLAIIGLDFGDAPDPTYPTLRASDGARHVLGTELFLGADVDDEPDGQPASLALGDDINNDDDEDGVTFISALTNGEPASLDVTASMNGMLDAWIDYNGDGDWTDPGEQIFAGRSLVAGSNSLGFTVPATPTPTILTFARFRVSSAGGLGVDGPAPDGEVEDYVVLVNEAPAEKLDFGDAPDPTYPTLASNDGARHVLGTDLFLGADVDDEPDGQPGLLALGDDLNNNDEDGVTFNSALTNGEPASIDVTASTNGMLDAWIDYTGDGDWADPGEQIFAGRPLVAGSNVLGFMVPATSTNVTFTFARFRVSSVGGLGFDGPAPDGEVEDYLVLIISPTGENLDFGDAPDPTYPTLASSDGARHVLGAGLFLGTNVDAEAEGQATGAADGDDTNGISDEDGIVFTIDLVQGSTSCVDVVASGPGLLDAWIDFDGSGAWGDFVGEQIFENQAISGGPNAGLCFAVPVAPHVGATYARFRFSQGGGLAPSGLAADGEVEDYALTLFQTGPTTNIVLADPMLVSTNGMVSFTWSAETNVVYQLQSTLDLLEQPNQIWSNVGSQVFGPANTQDDSSAGTTQKYYRVVVPFLP